MSFCQDVLCFWHFHVLVKHFIFKNTQTEGFGVEGDAGLREPGGGY